MSPMLLVSSCIPRIARVRHVYAVKSSNNRHLQGHASLHIYDMPCWLLRCRGPASKSKDSMLSLMGASVRSTLYYSSVLDFFPQDRILKLDFVSLSNLWDWLPIPLV